MEEYPDPDEEYELMYQEELEMIRQMDDDYDCPRKSKRSLDFSSPKSSPSLSAPGNKGQACGAGFQIIESTCSLDVEINGLSSQTLNTNDDTLSKGGNADPPLNGDDVPLSQEPTTLTDAILPSLLEEGKKRKVEDLFGDIADIEMEEFRNWLAKKKKTECVNQEEGIQDEDLIRKIIEGRKQAQERLRVGSIMGRSQQTSNSVSGATNMTRRVPKWPFLPLVAPGGERWFVRLRSEQFMEEQIDNIAVQGRTVGLLTLPYQTIWKTAQELIEKRLEREQTEIDAHLAHSLQESESKIVEEGSELWVDKYKPRSYLELLSDESTNRTLLQWLKLWDKVVFNRERKVRQKPKEDKNKQDGRFSKKPQQFVVNDDLDEHSRPQQKLALLCGPPGLGKTTLAHMIATHAGYNVVEVNASDDRSPEAFRLQLEAATQMRSVMGQEPRPNCLVLDEIDGAPAAAIELLVKFATGKDVGKGRGKKKASGAGLLKRPIICICNDVYVPALRPLRQLSLVVHFPPTASSRLAQRLLEIARKQHIRTDMTALFALAEKTHNDIRSCLGLLHFFKSQKKGVKLSDIQRSSVGEKDMQKGLFAVWQEIFQIQRPRQKLIESQHTPRESELEPMPDLNSPEMKFGNMALPTRMQSILRTVQSYGEYERLMQGVYENFLKMNFKDSHLEGVSTGLDWFAYMDVLNKEIRSQQNYVLMPYIPYAFVLWHLMFSSLAWPKLSYPSVGYEMSVKETRCSQLMAELMKGMCPSIRSCALAENLLLDTLPMMLHIIVPNLRPVNTQLYNSREKAELSQVINIMIEYNLNYVQERTPEGSYVYTLDPNIEYLCCYPGMKSTRVLSYGGKQLVAHELELEKLRRAWEKLDITNNAPDSMDTGESEQRASLEPIRTSRSAEGPRKDVMINKITNTQLLPNHLQTLVPKVVTPDKVPVFKDFFGRVLEQNKSVNKVHTDEIVKSDIWFHFKEGFSNAVRRSVKMKDLC